MKTYKAVWELKEAQRFLAKIKKLPQYYYIRRSDDTRITGYKCKVIVYCHIRGVKKEFMTYYTANSIDGLFLSRLGGRTGGATPPPGTIK